MCIWLARLLERGRRYQEKLADAQRQAEKAPRDPANGQLLFKPKTFRAPQWERNPEGGRVGRAGCCSRTEVWHSGHAHLLHALPHMPALPVASPSSFFGFGR